MTAAELIAAQQELIQKQQRLINKLIKRRCERCKDWSYDCSICSAYFKKIAEFKTKAEKFREGE